MVRCLYCAKEISFQSTWSKCLDVAFTCCETCLTDFIAIGEKRCIQCSRPYQEGRFAKRGEICLECKELWYKSNLKGNRSLFFYDEMAKQWMERFKFRGDVALIEMFSLSLQQVYTKYYKHIDYIVPVPL